MDTGIFLQLRKFIGLDNFVNLFTTDRLFFSIGPSGQGRTAPDGVTLAPG